MVGKKQPLPTPARTCDQMARAVAASIRDSGKLVLVSPHDRAGPTRRDRKLVSALHRRDPRALELIDDRYGAVLLGFLTDLLGDRAAAEDVRQVTLIEVWQRAKTYDPHRGTLLTWILTIGRSRAIDELRRRVPEPYDPLTPPAQSEAQSHETADALLETWRVAGLLALLPREEAMILRLRFYEGLSQREIAERTGIALGTVKMRMVKALERLREMIDTEREEP
jgi:RNA polymerase sigma-70 factor, ECF subfamily